MIGKAKKAFKILRTRGLSGFYRQLLWKKYLIGWNRRYQDWIKEYDTLTSEDISEMKRLIAELSNRPLISILMPVYNVDEKWLRRAIESVIEQAYQHWEFCIADDCSTRPHIRRVLEEYASRDKRIKVVFREQNGHISAASNSALELTTGEYTVLLDHDDELAKHALFMVALAVTSDPKIDMIYSDEDLIDHRGRRYFPKFKPDWSPDLLCSMNFVTHLSVYRTKILKAIGGFTIGREGSQDYDVALRFSERIPAENICHIPHVLYHWRAISGSVALASDEKSYAHGRAREAIDSHFERSSIRATSVPGFGELHRTIYELPEPQPLVSIVIVVGEQTDAEKAVRILERTDYKPFELILVSEGSIRLSSNDNVVKVLEHRKGSNFELLNEAVRESSGSVVCFLDASTVIKRRDWLVEAVATAIQPHIGCVGGKVLFPDNRIKHAGLIMGVGNGVGRAHYRLHKDSLGNFMRLHVAQNVSAVSSEFMAIRKDVFAGVGGFDASNSADAAADVDLCLRLRGDGLVNVWTPWAEVVQTSPPRTVGEDELERLKAKWAEYFERDPYFNPNLSNDDADFELAFPPRVDKFSL